jgi:hypothetical protein
VGFAIAPAVRVAGRVDDGGRGERIVPGTSVTLTWAPEGPGWPASGVTWSEAMRRCRYLSADGSALAETALDLWRLPTADEAVRSLARHGANSGGTWDSAAAHASYRVMPDKESPLWNPRSKVIYWWTATMRDSANALMIAYHGQVGPRRKSWGPGYLGFRAVRAIPR